MNDLRPIIREVLVNTIAASKLTPARLRYALYRIYGINTKSHALYPEIYFGGKNVTIDAGTFINNRCFFDTTADIVIGENCSIAMDVLFCTSTHEIGPSHKRAGKVYGKSIHVGNGVWIGACARILPGVTIGDGCIIAAGSVVNGDCEPNCLYGGVPAVKIKTLD